MHRAALALGIAAAAAGQFRHHALGVHAAGQHVAVVAVAGDDLVALLRAPSACRRPPPPGRYRGGRSRRSAPCRTSGRPSPRSGGSAASRGRRRVSWSLVSSGAAVAFSAGSADGASDGSALSLATAMVLLGRKAPPNDGLKSNSVYRRAAKACGTPHAQRWRGAQAAVFAWEMANERPRRKRAYPGCSGPLEDQRQFAPVRDSRAPPAPARPACRDRCSPT